MMELTCPCRVNLKLQSHYPRFVSRLSITILITKILPTSPPFIITVISRERVTCESL